MTAKVCVAVVAAFWLASSAAQAETKVTNSSGGWDAFGGTTTTGVPVCGISKDLKEKYFSVKLYSGDDTFTIQLSDADWKLAKGQKYDITMTFDQNKPWHATGTGFIFNDGDPGIEYEVRRQELSDFTSEFAGSSKLVLHLNQSGARDWSIDLGGVKDVKPDFETCTRKLK
jgi:hypothetical protein